MDDYREWICPHCGNTNEHWTQSKTFRQGWTTRAWQFKQCKEHGAQSENEQEEVLEAVAPFPWHKSSDIKLGTEEEDDYYSDDEAVKEEEEGENDDKNDEDDILDGITLKKTDVKQIPSCSQGGKVKNMKLELKNETEKVASGPKVVASGPSRRKRRRTAEKEKKVIAKKLKEN